MPSTPKSGEERTPHDVDGEDGGGQSSEEGEAATDAWLQADNPGGGGLFDTEWQAMHAKNHPSEVGAAGVAVFLWGCASEYQASSSCGHLSAVGRWHSE